MGSVSRFKLSLPQCDLPGILNCMLGRLSGFPSLYCRYLCISYKNYNYLTERKGQYEFKHTAKKSRGSLGSLPRKLTKVTSSGVEVNLAENIILFILLISAQLIYLYCVALIL